jgi:membrane glycosyltransferase
LSVSHTVELVPLMLATAVVLYGPKLLAVLLLLREPQARRDHGGAWSVLRGVIGESVFSTLLAPIVMLQHSWFVFNILAGISTGWGTQQRHDRALPLGFVVRNYLAHTLAGIVATLLLLRYAGDGFGWFVPLLAGLLLAIPLVRLTSSLTLGEAWRRRGWFLVACETHGVAVLSRAHALAAGHADESHSPRLVLDDAAVRGLHLALLSGMRPAPAQDRARLALLLESARRRDTSGFSRDDWTALLSDPESLRALGA